MTREGDYIRLKSIHGYSDEQIARLQVIDDAYMEDYSRLAREYEDQRAKVYKAWREERFRMIGVLDREVSAAEARDGDG